MREDHKIIIIQLIEVENRPAQNGFYSLFVAAIFKPKEIVFLRIVSEELTVKAFAPKLANATGMIKANLFIILT